MLTPLRAAPSVDEDWLAPEDKGRALLLAVTPTAGRLPAVDGMLPTHTAT